MPEPVSNQSGAPIASSAGARTTDGGTAHSGEAKRYRLHSFAKDVPYWLVLALYGFSIVAGVTWLPLSLLWGELEPALWSKPFEAIAFLVIAYWAERRRARG